MTSILPKDLELFIEYYQHKNAQQLKQCIPGYYTKEAKQSNLNRLQ